MADIFYPIFHEKDLPPVITSPMTILVEVEERVYRPVFMSMRDAVVFEFDDARLRDLAHQRIADVRLQHAQGKNP